MPEIDVAVVGAGPAGSICALELARAGLRVAMLEQTAFPRTKVCGEYVNLGAIAHLRELGLAERLAPLTAPVRGIRLFGAGVWTQLAFPQPAWAIARSSLDQALMRAAVEAGAHLLRGRVEDVQTASHGVMLAFRDEGGERQRLDARLAVGADGMESLVARKCGLETRSAGPARFALGGHYRGLRESDGYVEMYVRRHEYFAVNPLGGELANVMIVVDERRLAQWRGDLERRLRAMARELSGGRRDLEAIELEGKRVAIGPLRSRVRRTSAPGVLLAGDAAGFVDPFTGQGVLLAIGSGRRAAAAAVDVLCGGLPQLSLIHI